MFVSSTFALTNAQTRVTGTVSDEDGPVVGAIVQVKGITHTAVQTDNDGRYEINVPEGAKTLVFSLVGMKTQEVNIGGRTSINVLLEIGDDRKLDEVVITGKQVIDKRYNTGATDNIKADNARLGGMADISRGLEGRSSGVTVQNVSGTFGTAPKIRIRGATSIYGDSKPLWVVDNIIVEPMTEVSADALSSGDAATLISSAIAGLNPDDIESFQILKDGSTTSLYGARAMAGVIAVTTKKGYAGAKAINYTTELTYRLKPSYRNYNLMNSQEQMGIYKEMASKGWLNLADVFRARESGVYGRMYQLINTPISATEFALVNTPEAKNAYLREAEMRNTDWFDLLFKDDIMQNHALSITTGTTYASMSMMSDPGWTLQSKVQRYTANINTTYKISDGMNINLLSNGSYRKQRAPGTLSQAVDVVTGEVKRDFDINPYSYALNTSRTLDPKVFYVSNYAPFNILNELDNNYIDLDIVDLKFQGELKWKPFTDFGNIKILKSLEIGFLAAYNYKTTMQVHNVTGRANQANAYRAGIEPYEDNTIRENNPFLYTNPDNLNELPITVLPGITAGIYRNTNYKMSAFDTRTTLSWVEEFNEKHMVNFYAGFETNATDRYKNFFTGWGLDYDNGMVPTYIYEYFKKSIEEGNKYYSITETRARSLAGFTSVIYGYAGKYSVQLTFRNEATNKSSVSGSPWLPTWNVGLKWNASDEKFFDKIKKYVSYLSFRSSYSLTASPVPDFITNSEIFIESYTPYRPFTNIQEKGALRIYSLQNKELTYEKKNEFNFGFDLGVLNNRINVSFDIYSRKNFDLIGITPTSGIGGEIFKYANIANMDGNGIDLTISSKNIEKTKNNTNFTWSTDFVFGHFTTKVTKFESLTRVIDLVSGNGFTLEGYPARSLFSIPLVGLDENGYPVIAREDGTHTTIDDLYINFQNRDNLKYLKYEGPTEPTITGSLGNIFTYKNFRLNIFVSYSFGNVIRLDPFFKAYYSDLSAMTREFKNRWVLPGDEQYTNIPVILVSNKYEGHRNDLRTLYNAYNYTSIRTADGGFIRLKTVSLSYDFPKSWILNNMTNLSLKLEATNLLLLYADKKLNGQDPEFMNSGGVAVPTPKQFTLTIRAGF
ncbi:MAG: SusC/RagA family TonB-linked outer membrane protein [Paludibacter sp.]|nr:SusC/RagA family TonB-linked outer membrane protein [Paludibacter sp.]